MSNCLSLQFQFRLDVWINSWSSLTHFQFFQNEKCEFSLNATKLTALGRMRSLPFLCFPPQCMIMKETSVLKRSATENFCSSWIFNGQLLLESCSPHSVSFPFSFAERWKRKEEEEQKLKQTNPTAQTTNTDRKRDHWGVDVWNTTGELTENVCTSILFQNFWCCLCMDFSTFWINKITKRGMQIRLFFFPSPGNNSYCLIILDVINLYHQ